MRVLVGILVILLLTTCRKDGSETPIPGNGCGSVSGIQRTDLNGVPIPPHENTDWRIAEDWCPAVEALFAGRPPVVIVTTAPDSLVIACYPNPTDHIMVLGFYRDDSTYVDIRFVDEQFQLLYSLDSLTTRNRWFELDSMGITGPRIIRAYYRVVHGDGTAHRGHGDIQIDE